MVEEKDRSRKRTRPEQRTVFQAKQRRAIKENRETARGKKRTSRREKTQTRGGSRRRATARLGRKKWGGELGLWTPRASRFVRAMVKGGGIRGTGEEMARRSRTATVIKKKMRKKTGGRQNQCVKKRGDRAAGRKKGISFDAARKGKKKKKKKAFNRDRFRKRTGMTHIRGN